MRTFTLKLNYSKWQLGKLYKVFIPLMLCMFISTHLQGQSPQTQIQEIRLIGELPGHVDVKFKVVKCENRETNQVFLLLHNESERYNEPSDVSSAFDIVILNYDNGESFSRNIPFSASVGQRITADCENESPLKIDLPASFPPSSIAAYIKLNSN